MTTRKALVTLLLVVAGLGIQAHTETVQAQETVQINITGVPGVLPSPFLSDLEDDIVSGRYQVQFTYIPSGMSLSMDPVEVAFRVRLFHNRELLVDERSLPAEFEPNITHVLSPVFDRIEFESTLEDVLSSVRSSLQRQMIQTGALPEGDYRLELDAEVLSGQRVNVIPGVALFSVSYPPPPQLITPGNRTNVAMSTPVFSWSPVLTRVPVSLEYEFLLVEMFDGQGPEDAIDANRPHHEQTLMDVTSFVYTPDLFPLERGRSYAWMVRAFGAGEDIPVRNDGESEIFMFTYEESRVKPEDIANLQQISLVPGLARLINLDDLEVEDTGMFYELNGRAEVELTMNELSAEPIRLAANVRGLAIQQTGLENPVVAGGEVDIRIDPVNEILQRQRHFLSLNDMSFRFGQGIQAKASLSTKLFGRLEADGELMVTTDGFWGTVTATLRDRMEFSEGPVTVRIDEVSATFPEAELSASASVEMQGVDRPCTITQLDIQGDILETNFSCRNIPPMPIVGGSTLAELRPNFIFGEILMDPQEDRLEFDITKDARLAINRPGEQELCHVHFQAAYRTGERIEIRPIRQSCDVREVGLDLGFAEVMLRNLELGHLELNPSDGQWDFSLSFDSRLKVELFGGWQSPWMENTTISNTGIAFEEFEFVRNSPTLPDFDISNLVVNLQRFAIEEFTFPVFDWEGSGPGPWEVVFDGDLQFPPGAGFPSCLAGVGLKFANGTVADDRAIMPFSLNLPEPCRWEFGAGYAVNVAGVSGMLGAEWEPLGDGQQIRPFADLNLQGGFSTGYPFNCGETGSQSQPQVEVSFAGGLHAELQNIHPDCPMQIGPFQGQVNESSLSLSWVQANGQQGELGGDVTLQFSDNVQANGSFLIDIIQGRFVDGDITIDGPFDWTIPSDEYGVLTFRINQASISADGLFIDGRQSLRLGDDPIGVTFDELLLDLHDLSIRSGQIIFDEAFALEAGIDTDRRLQFAALPPDSNTTLDPGLYMELGSTVIIDSTGIGTTGQGKAALYYGDKSFDSNVTVEYTDDFRMSLYPFGVASGRADIYWNDSKVAYIDRNGLQPVFAFFADLLIPDILPLPSQSVAYLRLRDDEGNLLVEGTETPDGDYALSTLPGESLTLVVPAWDPSNPPEVAGAQLHNVVLSGNPSMPAIIGGGVTVDISSDDALYDLTGRNIPLRLTRIHFGETIPDEDMVTMSALYLEGHLHLFDNQLDEAGSVGFLLGDGGLVYAILDLSDMNQPVPMVPGSNRVVYTLNELQGSFQGSLDGSVPASYGFDIVGAFEINDAQQTVASTALDVHLTQSTFEVTAYDGEMADLPRFNLGFFGLEVTEVVRFPHLSWSSEDGFSFEVAVDLSLHFNLSEGTSFYFPFEGVEIRDSGIVIPPQDVSISSMPGLTLPSFELLGMQFRPLALRTMAELEVDWYQNEFSFNLDPRIDFELHLPAFADTDLHPTDGLTFSDVGFEDGHLVGTVQTHIPLGGAMVPLGPPTMNPPVILVDSLGGSLTREVTAEGPQQTVSLYAYSRLENLPAFTRPGDDDSGDPCAQSPDVTLQIIDGSGFAGSVEGFQSCGEVELGPLALGIEDASLHFSFADGEQSLRASGTIGATLPAPGGNEISVSGSGEIDLFTGVITDGSIAITDEFLLAYGPSANPLFEFTVQQAILDANGFQISGQGSFGSDVISVDVAFNELLFELPSFTVASGNAVISPGFSIQVGTDLSSISARFGDEPMDMDNVFRYTMDDEIVISSDGVSFTGAGTASLLYQGESFIDLSLQFRDDFTVEVRQHRIVAIQGRAEFYLTDPTNEYYEEGEPFVIWDPSGLSIAGGVLALLPDRIGLPNEDIAYIVLKDDDGQPLLEYYALQGGGYELTTGEDHLPVVIPALAVAGGEDPGFLVGFTLQTDNEFNVTGGSLSLAEGESGDLGPNLNLPVMLTALELDNTDGSLQLRASLRAELPSVFEGHDATGTLILDQAEGLSAVIDVGTYTDSWDPSLADDPLYEFVYQQNMGGADDDQFAANLYGIRMEIGQNPALRFSAGITSTILAAEPGSPHSLFFAASYDDGGWDASVSYDFPVGGLDLGLARFIPEEHEALSLDISSDRFVASFSGLVTFNDLLGDDFAIHVEELEFGVEGLQSSPSLVFGLGQATAQLPDQEFDLLEGTLTGSFSGSALSISGRTLTLTSSQGNVTFLQQELQYQDFMVSTAGDFAIGNIGTDGFGLFQEYVVLNGLGVAYDSEEGLSISSNFTVNLPDPVSKSASASVSFRRDPDSKQIHIESEGPDFEFEQESYPIGTLAVFYLHDAAVNINIQQPNMSRLVANGGIFYDGDEVISFGKKGNMDDNAGISFRPSRSPNPLQYNITGNIDFSLEYSFFEIHLQAEAGASNVNSNEFEVVLGGTAGLTLDAISGTVSYRGFTITSEGVKDIGGFDLSEGVSFTVMGFAELELGQFFYGDYRDSQTGSMDLTMEKSGGAEAADDGTINISSQAETVQVTQFLCFGSYPGIQTATGDGCGADNDALKLTLGGQGGSGGFRIEIEGLLFYETTDGAQLFYMDGISLEVHEMLSVSGTIQYENDDDGVLLRLAADGSFGIGEGGGVDAMIAGKFENRNGLSFGLFAAVDFVHGDIPLVPPFVNLAGIGGGFFYNPDPADISFVHSALANFGYTLYRPDAAVQPDDDLKFAAMLYARLNMVGAGGFSIITGQTYIEVTNQALYFDAAGSVLGLDGAGTPAGLDLSANMYLALQFGEPGSGFDEFLLQGGFRMSISIPVYMTGEGTLDFFAGRVGRGDPVVWGVQGDFHIDILSLLDGKITFLASDVGFYFEGGLGIGFSVFIFSFQSDLEASVWYVRDPVAMGSAAAQDYPAGGYATARVEFCTFRERGCVGADAVGAFIRQSQGFKVLAGASVWKLSGHIIVTSGGDISAHTGGVEDNPAILAAQSLKDDFESYLDELAASLAAAEQAVQESLRQITYDAPDAALIENAGYNLIAGAPLFRSNWAGHIRSNEQNSSGFFPPALNGQLSWVEARRTQSVRNGTFKVTTQQNISDLTSMISQVSGTVLAKLDALMLEAIEIEQQIQQVYADFLDVMQESPVKEWSVVSPGNYQTESPSFQIDMDQAAQQAQQAENLDQVMSEMGLAMIQPLQQVEALLTDVDSAMFEQDESQAVELADIYFHPDPSVMGFARMYESAIQLISGFKVNQANYLWVKADWATQWRTHFDQNSSQRNSAIQQITDALVDMDPGHSDFYEERVVTGNRMQILYQLDNKDSFFRPVNSWGEVNQNARNYFLSTSDPDPAQVYERNHDFWHKMFDLGIDAYISSLGERLEQVFASYEDLHNPMAEAHRNLTAAIEDFYDLQASSYSIYYAMIDNFVATFENSEGQIEENLQQYVSYYTAKREQVAEMLAPPEFQAITVTPNRPQNNFFNETNISWNVTHPHGVIESAIQIESGGGAGGLDIYHGLDQYRSTGLSQSIDVYLTRTTGLDITPQNIRSATHNTLDLNVGVRARGPAGTVATRRASFQVDVGPEGTGVPPGHNALPDQYPDTPPDPPIAELHETKGFNMVILETGEVYTGSGGLQFQGMTAQMVGSELGYWTNNNQVITIQARAGDDITGISSFEYAVGSSPGEQDIIEWTLLAGPVTQSSDGFQRIRGDTRFIGLEEGEEYYVSLRATNGAGVTSAPTLVDIPVRYETNPPANIEEDTFDDPLITVLGYPIIFYASFGSPTVYDPVYHAPTGFHESFNPHGVNTEQRVNPKVAVTWTASSDTESGFSHYEYVVTSTPVVSNAQFADAPTTRENHVIIEGGPGSEYENVFSNFRDPVYIHVRAVDFAGNASDILTMEQVPYDPRRPYAPIMQGQSGTNELRLHLTGPAYDPESGLKGIQYSVGTSPGSSNVISWPSGNEINMVHTNSYLDSYLNPVTQNVMGQEVTVSGGKMILLQGLPHISIPAPELPEGQQLYINYRAVNEQGHRSIVRSTGPVAIDNEAPLVQSVFRTLTPNILISQIVANYEINDIHDPVSGVIKVEVKVTQGNFDSGWWVVEEYDVPKQGPFSIFDSIVLSIDHIDYDNLDDVFIWARVTNGVHLQTVKGSPPPTIIQAIDHSEFNQIRFGF